MVLLDQVACHHRDYDVVHFHIDYLHFLLSRQLEIPHLTTLHGRLDLPDLTPLYDRYPDMPVVSISDAQRTPLPQARWLGTVLHGLPLEALEYSPAASDHFAFVGRISPEKRVDRAAEIATTLGTRLKVGAKIDKADRDYYEQQIAAVLEHPLIEFVGEITEQQKSQFLGSARALLFPIDWPEPFGLVMIEAMACGTPVIAFDHGSVREVIEDGVSGFIVSDMPSAIQAAQRVGELSRRAVRESFERRFTSQRMARDYLALYRQVTRRKTGNPFDIEAA
jgi:glycosyltransferase involved in cell wall biosynthesis